MKEYTLTVWYTDPWDSTFDQFMDVYINAETEDEAIIKLHEMFGDNYSFQCITESHEK